MYIEDILELYFVIIVNLFGLRKLQLCSKFSCVILFYDCLFDDMASCCKPKYTNLNFDCKCADYWHNNSGQADCSFNFVQTMEWWAHWYRGLSPSFHQKSSIFVWRAERITMINLLPLNVICAVYLKDNFTALMIYYFTIPDRWPVLALQMHRGFMIYCVTFIINLHTCIGIKH